MMKGFLEQVREVKPVCNEGLMQMAGARSVKFIGSEYPLDGDDIPRTYAGRDIRVGDRLYFGCMGTDNNLHIMSFVREEIGTVYRMVNRGFFPRLEKIT
jgi:hypothetical protein